MQAYTYMVHYTHMRHLLRVGGEEHRAHTVLHQVGRHGIDIAAEGLAAAGGARSLRSDARVAVTHLWHTYILASCRT